jgi:hypothetical protein
MESKFTKSKKNKETENQGLALLLADPRFQRVDLKTKRRILELVHERIGTTGTYGTRTFDLVMTPAPVPAITVDNVDGYFDEIRLVEMKTTRDSIRDESLSGFFFGATEREYMMASALKDRYLFAFVVLSADNEYGRPFAVLLTINEVEGRTKTQRTQFQVNLRTDLVADAGQAGRAHVILGPVTNAEE